MGSSTSFVSSSGGNPNKISEFKDFTEYICSDKVLIENVILVKFPLNKNNDKWWMKTLSFGLSNQLWHWMIVLSLSDGKYIGVTYSGDIMIYSGNTKEEAVRVISKFYHYEGDYCKPIKASIKKSYNSYKDRLKGIKRKYNVLNGNCKDFCRDEILFLTDHKFHFWPGE